jgi:REP element-mobilizing transposase RayT
MSHVFHQLYYHFIWGTNDRQPLITAALRPELLRIQAEEVAQRGGILVRHNAMPDHVHLLVRLTPNLLVSDFIGQVKGCVSYRVNKQIAPPIALKWQEGYGVLSIREGDVATVSRYIDRQEELHQKRKLSRILEILEGT